MPWCHEARGWPAVVCALFLSVISCYSAEVSEEVWDGSFGREPTIDVRFGVSKMSDSSDPLLVGTAALHFFVWHEQTNLENLWWRSAHRIPRRLILALLVFNAQEDIMRDRMIKRLTKFSERFAAEERAERLDECVNHRPICIAIGNEILAHRALLNLTGKEVELINYHIGAMTKGMNPSYNPHAPRPTEPGRSAAGSPPQPSPPGGKAEP